MTGLADLDTPLVAVDLDVFERNVATCFARLAGVRVRPHQKTTKSPEVAWLLLRAGARGVCVATLAEAEAMLAAGIDDVLITSELAGPVKARRLAEVVRRWPRAQVTVVLDSFEGAAALDAELPRPIPALIEVNVGQDRCGVAPEEAVGLAGRVAAIERLTIVGVQGYEGNLQHVRDAGERRRLCHAAMGRLACAADALRADGHAVDVVTTGGTGTAEFCAEHPAVTEVQPGSFVFMDTDYGATGGVPYARSLTVHATVISHATATRAVVDAGLKALSLESGLPRVAEPAGWTYAFGGDEHGILTPAAGAEPLAVGDRVVLEPSHIDTTVNLHAVMHAVRAGRVEATWPVSARGWT